MDEKITRLQKFYEFLSQDDEIRAEFTAKISQDMKDTAKEFADKHGIDISMDDLHAGAENGKLSMDELAAVAGGDHCGCMAGGGGTGGGTYEREGHEMHSTTCACVGGGWGMGDCTQTFESDTRCYCAFYGNGDRG